MGKLNSVMVKNGVLNVNFKGFKVDLAHANWIVVKNISSEGDSTLPMVGCECTCLFYWSQRLDKVTQKYIKTSLQFQYKHLCKDYEDEKIMDEAKLNIMSFVHGGCYLDLP